MEISASSKEPTPFYALIAAAGSGSRLGGDLPKQYQKIAGKPILQHTLEMFLSCPGLQAIAVIIDPAHRDHYESIAEQLELFEPVTGGKDRRISVFSGLRYFSNLMDDDIILIHDAARPFITYEEIQEVAHQAATHGAATLATPVTDTQKYDNGDYVKRENLWAIQTPQGFRYGLVVDAHEKAHEKADSNAIYTDDTGLVAALGHKIEMVPGKRANIKITTQEDMEIAKKMLSSGPAPHPFETRTGFGYDVHAFTEGHTVHLCGVEIPHLRTLKGHSDADAGLHAITDALFGTIGAGDIGTHFPPSDPQWKDCDSTVFLKKALNMISARKGKLVNIDLTFICEEPKISPHAAAMQQRVANLCGLSADRVGIKATTSERMGFLGRSEGLAAQAVVSVKFPVEES